MEKIKKEYGIVIKNLVKNNMNMHGKISNKEIGGKLVQIYLQE